MATADDVRINVIAETKQAIAGMAKFAAGVGAAVLVARKLVQVGRDMVMAFAEQEQAEARLAAALKSTGREAEINQDALEDMASSLQKVTTYGDEATISAMAMLQQLANLNEEGLKKVTPALLDFAAAQNVDLQTAAQLVGKTLGSTTNALSRYGVVLDATAPPAEKLEELVTALNEKFAGTAEAIGATTLGRLEQFKSAMGDLKEQGGELLSKFLTPAAEAFTALFASINEISNRRAERKALEDYLNFRDTDYGLALKEQTRIMYEAWDNYYEAKARLEDKDSARNQRRADEAREIYEKEREIYETLERVIGRQAAAGESLAGVSEELTQGQQDYIDVTATLNEELAMITEKEEALGDLYDDRAAQVRAVQKAIEELVERGYLTENANIQTLLDTYGHYLEKQEEVEENYGILAQLSGFMIDVLEAEGEAQRTLNAMKDEGALADIAFLETEKKLAETIDDTTRAIEAQQLSFDEMAATLARWSPMYAELVEEQNKELKEQPEIYKDIATAALPIFEAMGAGILDASKGWEAFKEAAKDAIASVLLAIARREAVLALAAFGTPAMAGHAAAAAAASIGAGFVKALAEGGIVTQPTLALVGEQGPEAVVPLNKGSVGGNALVVNVYGNLLTERQLIDGILNRAAAHMRQY